jgi:hypothetical protein
MAKKTGYFIMQTLPQDRDAEGSALPGLRNSFSEKTADRISEVL